MRARTYTAHAAVLTVVILAAQSLLAQSCTVIAAGKAATTDGSVFVSHTDDQSPSTADLRVVRVPEAWHHEDGTRAVYLPQTMFPRVVTYERGPEYMPKEGQESWIPLGYIPQVRRTNSYFDQDFAFMNQAQVIIAETTIAAKTAGWPVSLSYGYNMMSMEELTKIAMERCSTARCAVKTMGDLAVEYGYYAIGSGDPAHPEYGGAAEAAAVGDKEEAWIFHVMTGPNNASAVWAAQRVPDNEVAAMPNAMIIRQMNLSDSDNFLASDNVLSFAKEQGWWDPEKGPFDFAAAYAYDASCSAVEWEFAHNALYAGRRLWRVYDLLAPSLNLDSTLGWVPKVPTFPFSIEPDHPVSVQDLMAVLRDTYNGTKYDLSQGLKGGPFSTPLQYDPPRYKNYTIAGDWERPISVYRMLYSFVGVARSWLPDHVGGLVWLGLGRSLTSVYVPFYAGHTEMPRSYLEGLESKFNFDSSWWAFTLVSNIAQLKWSFMIKDIRAEQQRLESSMFERQAELEKRALEIADPAESAKMLEEACNDQAAMVTEAWWALAWRLISTYSDGFITRGESGSRRRIPGYPQWWLEATGDFQKWPGNTFKDPRRPDDCKDPTLAFGQQTLAVSLPQQQISKGNELLAAIANSRALNTIFVQVSATAVLAVVVGIALGYAIASQRVRVARNPAADADTNCPLL